jgi:hypothetical protein
VRLDDRFRQFVNATGVFITPDRYKPEWVDWQPAAVEPGAITVFAAADSIYFRKFGLAFLASLVRHHPTVHVHFHLYDPDRESLSFLAEWKAQFPAASISHSVERLPALARRALTGTRKKQSWKSLYICCTRFLAARHLQRTVGCAILLMDIDVIFAGRIEPIFAGSDYGLMPRPTQQNWCKRTLGGVVFARPSPLGQAFLDHACLQIGKFLTRGRYWFAFDQYGLYRALLHMKRRDGLAHFCALTDRHVSFDLAAEAPILYPKGRSKEGEAFSALASDAVLAG